MKGIILAGGTGTRLYPSTKSISKQLLPLYDKPMIYYPLASLMQTGIQEILIITTPRDLESFKDLLGDGSDWGINLSYMTQSHPGGIAQAFIIGKDFIKNESVCLILGDNLFYGEGLDTQFAKASHLKEGAIVFAYRVSDPDRYGVVGFDEFNNAISIEEKPLSPKSDFAVTGIYFYDSQVSHIAEQLKPSARGELEITDLNRIYLSQKKLKVETIGRGQAWLDTGTHDSLMEASNFVHAIEKRQGLKIACLEEIAYMKGWVTKEKLIEFANQYKNNSYAKYVNKLWK